MLTKLNRANKILLITNSLILLAGAAVGPIYALFVEEVGGNLMDASLAGAAFALAAGVTVLISGKYADKIKENELIIVFGYTVIGIGFLLYMFVKSIWFLLIVQVIIGLGEAIYSPAFDAVYTKHLRGGGYGSQWSFWYAMSYIVTAVGAIIGGLLVTFLGFYVVFLILALLCFTSAIYIYLLPRKVL